VTKPIRLYRPGALIGRRCRIQCNDGLQEGKVITQENGQIEVLLDDGRQAYGQPSGPEFELLY
jgi:hypothetical protein